MVVVTPFDPSLSEWVVLSLLAEAPAHGFAIARELEPASDLGRILTVHRPQVYRALDRLVEAGLAEPRPAEPSLGGPKRTRHAITSSGRRAVDDWLATPVGHVRDLRIEFLAKLRLTERRGRPVAALVSTQTDALAEAVRHLTRLDPTADVVDRWRRHNALAASAFLRDLIDGR